MRPLILGVAVASLLSFPSLAAPPAQNLSTRSPHHELRLTRTVISTQKIAYDVEVTDLDTGNVLLKSHLTGTPSQPVEARTTVGDQQVHVRLAMSPNFFTATVAVVSGGSVADEFRTWWQLESRKDGAMRRSVPPPQRDVIQPGGSGPYRVGGDVKAPRVVRRVEPIYPEAARVERISGIVIVEAVIGKDGRVKNAVVLKGLPDGLSDAALDAVKQWEFEPATLHGEPVDVIFNLTMNFRLDAPPPPQP